MNKEDFDNDRFIKDDYNFDPMTGEKIIKDDYNFDPMTGEKNCKKPMNNLNNLILRGINQTIKSLLL